MLWDTYSPIRETNTRKATNLKLRNAGVETDLYVIQLQKIRICPKRPAGHPIQKVPPKGTMLLTVAGG